MTFDDPILYYAYDDGAGVNVTDKSGNGFTGTLTNGANGSVDWATGRFKIGKGILFTATDPASLNAYVQCPDVTALRFTCPFTISAWINVTDIINQNFIGSRTTGDSNISLKITTDGSLSLYAGKYGEAIVISLYSSSGIITVGNWYFVGATYDTDGTVRIYCNDQIVDSDNKIIVEWGQIVTENPTWRVGYYWSGDVGFRGYYDESRIYNRALTQTEMLALYNFNDPRGIVNCNRVVQQRRGKVV